MDESALKNPRSDVWWSIPWPPPDCSRFWDAVGAAVALEWMLDYAEEQRAFYTLQVLHDAFGQMPPGH